MIGSSLRIQDLHMPGRVSRGIWTPLESFQGPPSGQSFWGFVELQPTHVTSPYFVILISIMLQSRLQTVPTSIFPSTPSDRQVKLARVLSSASVLLQPRYKTKIYIFQNLPRNRLTVALAITPIFTNFSSKCDECSILETTEHLSQVFECLDTRREGPRQRRYKAQGHKACKAQGSRLKARGHKASILPRY